MLNLLVVSRGSLSTKKNVISRSLYCRILEPLEYLTETSGDFRVYIYAVEDISDEILRKMDVVIFCKHNTEKSLNLCKRAIDQGRKVIYDIDDLIYKFTKDSLAYDHMSNVGYLKEHLELADSVVISTATLAGVLSKDFPKIRKQCLIPTGINTEKYGKAMFDRSSRDVLFTNGDNIKITAFKSDFTQTFNHFLKNHPDARFDVFGDSENYLTGFERYNFLGSLPWDEHKRYLQKSNYRFAVIPLGGEEEDVEHQLFSRCKSPIKYLEYATLKIPGIYSDVFIYNGVVKNHETGFLVPNDGLSWARAFEEVARDDSLLKRITENAFEDVQQNHHIRFASQRWRNVVESVYL